MKILIQRCDNARVTVGNKYRKEIGKGLVIFVGFTNGDDDSIIDYMIDKILNLRIFDDEKGVMNKSIIDISGSILSISQFTLYAQVNKGKRPSYKDALGKEKAEVLYNSFNDKLKKYIKVETGIFGANMDVSLTNNGPVTIILDKDKNSE